MLNGMNKKRIREKPTKSDGTSVQGIAKPQLRVVEV